MLFVPRDVGGIVRWRAPRRSTIAAGTDSVPQVTIYNDSGGTQIATAAGTLDPVNTTLDGASAAGATSLNLTAITNVSRDDEYLVGPNVVGQREFVKVAGIDATGTSVTLRHPTLYGYQAATLFVGTYQVVAIAAASVADSYTDWRAHFAWQLLGVLQPPGIVRFDVIRHWISHQPCTMADVLSYDSELTFRLPASYNYEWALDQALNDVIREINQTAAAGGIIADDDWKQLVALRFLSAYVGPALGEKGAVYREIWGARYAAAYATWKPQIAVDEDEDGAIEDQERRPLGGELYRC